MPDVDFYRLYNGLWARDLMPCFCPDFCDFHKSLPCFFAIFCRDFLLSLNNTLLLYQLIDINSGSTHRQIQHTTSSGHICESVCPRPPPNTVIHTHSRQQITLLFYSFLFVFRFSPISLFLFVTALRS